MPTSDRWRSAIGGKELDVEHETLKSDYRPRMNEEVGKYDEGKASDCATSDAQNHAVGLGQGLTSAPERWTGPKLEPVIANLPISLRN